MPQTETIYNIPLCDAVRWTTAWREKNPESTRAFKVDACELKDVIDELGKVFQGEKLPYVRFYLAIKDTGKEGLVLVGVDKDGNDICQFVNKQDTEESGTYDFTHPCPDTCDQSGSPLNGNVVPPILKANK